MDTEKKKIKILVVEDEDLLVQAIEKKLKQHNILAIISYTGEEGLIMLEKAKQLPDIVWLDFYLPDMNGIEFMKRLRTSEKTKNMKVIVVSNSTNEESLAKLSAFGIDKYVVKAEYRLDQIVEMVNNLVKN